MGSTMPFKGNPPKIDEPPQHTDATHSFSLFVREKPILIRGISTALYSMWSFHLHSVVKIQPFSPVFPLAGTTAKAFFRLSLWSFKEKASIIFYNTAFQYIISTCNLYGKAFNFSFARPMWRYCLHLCGKAVP